MIAGRLTVPDLMELDRASLPAKPAPERPRYLIGLDLGQAQDYSAWVVAQEIARAGDEALYDVGHVDRVHNARYPAVVAHTSAMIAALRSQEPCPSIDLVVDFTGVGRAVADMIVEAIRGAEVTLVTITGGDAVTRGDRHEWRVPKRDLAAVIQVLLQSNRLRIAEGLPLAQTMTEELVNFRVKISLAGHDSYGAGAEWRDGNHDDLVLALALSCWHGENAPKPRIWL